MRKIFNMILRIFVKSSFSVLFAFIFTKLTFDQGNAFSWIHKTGAYFYKFIGTLYLSEPEAGTIEADLMIVTFILYGSITLFLISYASKVIHIIYSNKQNLVH